MTPGARTRILIVDDSAVVRNLLRQVLAQDSTMEVAGTAASGEAVSALVSRLRPDLLLLDVEMPRMGGLEALRELRARGDRMPVVMCSSLTERGAQVTMEALAAGASDYVAKPSGQQNARSAVQTLAGELLPKIRALTAPRPRLVEPLPERWTAAEELQPCDAAEAPALVVIGVSTGGPHALEIVLSALPREFPVPLLVVQHMPELFTGTLAQQLNERSLIPVREAAEGDLLRARTAYVARGNWHMEVLPAARAGLAASLHLTQAPPENHCRPSVDVTMRSATAAFGAGVLAVQLTGMGSDGLEGCRAVRARGGIVVAQDEATSAVWGMPGAVVQAGLAQRVLPIQEIASFIVQLTSPAHRGWRVGKEAVS